MYCWRLNTFSLKLYRTKIQGILQVIPYICCNLDIFFLCGKAPFLTASPHCSKENQVFAYFIYSVLSRHKWSMSQVYCSFLEGVWSLQEEITFKDDLFNCKWWALNRQGEHRLQTTAIGYRWSAFPWCGHSATFLSTKISFCLKTWLFRTSKGYTVHQGEKEEKRPPSQPLLHVLCWNDCFTLL